jgi:hypothetical protein
MSSITTSDLNNYTNLHKHLNDLYVKIKEGKRDVEEGTKDFVEYYEELFPENILTSYTDNDRLDCDVNGSTTLNEKTFSLKRVLHNALYPTFHQTINDGPTNYKTISNSHISSSTVKKDHLCFIKLNAGKTDIEPDEHTITNILYSKYAIEIFIRIIEALKDCYHYYSKQLIDIFSSETPIFIVDRKLKSEHAENVPKGIFIKESGNETDSPPIGLYLYIGNLQNMFKDDLSVYEANMNDDAEIPDATKTAYLASKHQYIFKSNDKLYYTANGKYYFGYLKHINNDDGESPYAKQTGEVDGSEEIQKAYYKQNIYYIHNFLKMINNIDNDSFSTTIKYLHVKLLCFKSLLLSSMRAANIFYNNRYKLSALAIISYEDNLYKKATGNGDSDNDILFKEYDVKIQEEIDNIKNIGKDQKSDLGIENISLLTKFKLKAPFYIRSDDTNTNDTIEEESLFNSDASDTDYKNIMDMFSKNKKHDFNNNYRIKISGKTFKVINFQIRTDASGKKRIDIELEHNRDIPSDLFAKLNTFNKGTENAPINLAVDIVKITSKDIDKDYNNIVSNTDDVEQNINMYKTKIKNNTTLYELHKSRNNLLYNQVLSYLIIVAIIISILVIINVAAVEKPLIKSITVGCFAAIIILFMSYYIMNTLYIEEGFSAGSTSSFTGYELCSSADCKKADATPGKGSQENENSERNKKSKKNYVMAFLNKNAKDLILMIILETPSIVNDSLKGNNEKLVAISKNIYNEKLYLKDVLYSKKSDAEMNVDVLKYENKNYDVYIICILFLALIMVGSYTINIYTDNKYLDLLILIMVILFVCLFTYFVLYTNRIVRTVSTNYYWGNEYANEYI